MLTDDVRTRKVAYHHHGGRRVVERLTAVALMGIIIMGIDSGIPDAVADDAVCTAVGEYCGFRSPSGRIDCEINTGGRTGPDSVYCKTVDPAQSVQLNSTGIFQSCTGQSCLGDAAEGIPTLDYGQTTALGPFSCHSDVGGVTCTAAGGRGFTISTRGITNAA